MKFIYLLFPVLFSFYDHLVLCLNSKKVVAIVSKTLVSLSRILHEASIVKKRMTRDKALKDLLYGHASDLFLIV